MIAVILAAGRGSRLKTHTAELPKGMLPVRGESLISRQIRTLRRAGVSRIAVVTGYRGEKVAFPGVSLFSNPRWAETNMVESLFCAEPVLNDDVLVCYADILYEPRLVDTILRTKGDVVVAADEDWRAMWRFRYGCEETDLESFSVDEKDRILEIGTPLTDSRGLELRYIGMIKFNARAMAKASEIRSGKREAGTPWPRSGKATDQGYMTDLLDALIAAGTLDVRVARVKRGWWEFDTDEDYAKACDPTLRETFESFHSFDLDGAGP